MRCQISDYRPRQVKYNSTRKLVLKGVDGLVFVADFLKIRHEKKHPFLKKYGGKFTRFSAEYRMISAGHAVEVERDLVNQGLPLMTIEEMEHPYNRQLKAPSFEGSAVTGMGVNDTLKTCLVRTLRSLGRR